MSSSRSIAAARQRRAGEAPPVAQRGPVTSMGSQQAFAQQQMQQKQMRQPQQFTQPQPQHQQQKNGIPPEAPRVPVGKLSLGDAFALVTIRLGRLESIIQKLEAEGVIGENAAPNSSTMEHDENMRLVDDTVIRNIIARLGDLEKQNSKLTAQLQAKESNEGLTEDNIAMLVSESVGEIQKQVDELQNHIKENSFGLSAYEVTSIVTKHLEEVNGNISKLQTDLVSLNKGIGAEEVSTTIDQKLEEPLNQILQLKNDLHTLNVGVFEDIANLKSQHEAFQNELNELKDTTDNSLEQEVESSEEVKE